MDQGTHQSIHAVKGLLLTDILQRYMDEVTPSARGAKREAEDIKFMQRQKIAAYSMTKLMPAVLAAYRDERLKTVAAGTIIQQLSILSGIITHARKEWGLPTPNPCALVTKPSTPQGRTRLLTTEEETQLLDELKPVRRRSPWIVPLVKLALETAMHRGELLALRWKDIDLEAQTAFLQMTKNGSSGLVSVNESDRYSWGITKQRAGASFPHLIHDYELLLCGRV